MTIDSRRRPEHPAPLHRARPGAGGPGSVPAGQARHRAADRERLLLRLRRAGGLHPRRPEGDRAEDAPDRQAGPAVQPPGRQRRRGPRRARRRALQARADRPQGRRHRAGRRRRRRPGRLRRVGRGRRRRAHHLRQPGPGQRRAALEGPVPRPAPADDQEHPGVQADALRRRVLARQREEPAAAAHLRHRVAVARSPGRVPDADGGGARSAITASSAPSSTCSASRPRSAAGCRCSIPRAASSARRWRTTRASGTSRRATSSSTRPHITKSNLFETSGHLQWYADGHVPAHGDGGREVLPQADELPDAHPDLRIARPVLPRAAAAAVRVRHRVPVREVRRRARPDQGPRLHPGRLAHLLHARAAAGRAGQPARFRGRPAARLRPDRVRGRAVHPAGEVRRRDRRMGQGRGRAQVRAGQVGPDRT